MGDLLQEFGDSLVGFLGGFRQVPGVPFRLIGEPGGQLGVGAAALRAGRQLDDGRPDKRVAEREPFGGLVGAHDAGAFRGAQAFSPVVRGDRPDEAQVTGALKGGKEQQFVDRGGQPLDAGGEDILQSAAEG